MTDTIFALATPPGRAAVAVLRLSGPRVGEMIERLADDLPPARHAGLRVLRGADDEVLDEALVLWFPAPRSYTGEPCAELQLHGGGAVVDAVCGALVALGARPAEPGEFTRRAFENGRLDLTQAEAVADLVDAETQAQHRQALDQLGGALSKRYEAWRSLLLEALAVLEAAIDFPDEDLPADVGIRARPPVERLLGELDAALQDSQRGERVRAGYRIAVMGAPNAGKSSLLNRILGRDAAIVTATPGTTRDVIEAPLVLDGFKALIADMAGLRPAGDPIEAEGVRRAAAWAEGADLRIWVVDASSSDSGWLQAASLAKPGDLLALNKSDLPGGADARGASAAAAERGLETLETSATTGAGLDSLVRRLSAKASEALSGGEFPAATRERHRARLAEARDAVGRGLEALDRDAALAAEDLRLADWALGRISGRIEPEELLGRIFSTFCIGK